MAMQAVLFQVQLATCECCSCHMTFAMPREFEIARRQDHALFHCPAGHAQHFAGQSDAEKLRVELEREKRFKEFAQNDARAQREHAEHLERSRNAIRGHLSRTKRRVANGVCPCCNRTFQDLARHMASKHPRFNDRDEE